MGWGSGLGCIGDTKGKNTGNPDCGNGVRDPGEQCDDGNLRDHDGCSKECTTEGFCGNAVREPGEECDDGNFDDGDGCSYQCQAEEGCGNGRLDVGEECDDDNVYDLDGCNSMCVDEEPGVVCGNGVHELGEGCDDGNLTPGDGCDAACLREDGCGDGTQDASELCDDGNTVAGDGCSADCRVEYVCGNDYCEDANYETCEACPQDCCPDCGDGMLDDGEECDDGNNTGGDGCSRGCDDEDGTATCGNGIWELGEECEDGNVATHDGCSEVCETEFECGDQVCEYDMGETCQRCQPDCCPSCGNGVLEPLRGEWCDHLELGGKTCLGLGYDGGQLLCSAWCTYDKSGCTGTGPVCGNDSAEYGEQCDGNDLRGKSCPSIGWSGGTLGCSSCQYDTSSCTGLVWYFHEDFEDQESALQEWLYTGSWDWGTPTTVGPAACLDGNRCAGTSMTGSYGPSQSYATCVLESPTISLAGSTNPTLSLFNWLYTETYADDGGNVKISNDGGTTWTVLTPEGGYDGTVGSESAFYGDKRADGWHRKLFDLTAYAGDTIQLRFAFYSDGYTQYDGWYLDSMYITEAADVPVQITTPSDLGVALADFPYSRPLVADGGTGTFDWSKQAGGVNDAWVTVSATGLISGTPNTSQLGASTVVVRAAVPGNPTNFGEKTFSLDVATGIWLENFDSGIGSWTLSGDWQHGVPTTTPGACYGGSCIGTLLGGTYSHNMAWGACSATSPSIDLSGATNPLLQFQGWISTEGSSFDGCNVKVSTNGTTWTVLNTVTPSYNCSSVSSQPAWGEDFESWNAQWYTYSADLSAYAGQNVQIRFDFRSDSSVNSYPGCYVDEVVILD